MTRIMMITPNFENNSLGRTWCLWMLARNLGWQAEIYGVKGRRIWAPLADSDMAEYCHIPDNDKLRDLVLDDLVRVASQADLIVAVKPLLTSYGVALEVSERAKVPILLDIDDPDIEVRTTWKPRWERTARWIVKPEYRQLRGLAKKVARAHGITVSNPVLQGIYGGNIIPHVREIVPERRESTGTSPVVRFVGSVRGHKGIDVLRAAVSEVADLGVTLEITDDPPEEVHAWETWLGTTGIAEGKRLVSGADIIAVPSEDYSWSRAQLPAKLLDAMAAGRAIVASDLPTITWATGNSALHVKAGSAPELAAALRDLVDPELRESLGAAAYEHASKNFTPEILAPQWGQLCEQIVCDYKGK